MNEQAVQAVLAFTAELQASIQKLERKLEQCNAPAIYMEQLKDIKGFEQSKKAFADFLQDRNNDLNRQYKQRRCDFRSHVRSRSPTSETSMDSRFLLPEGHDRGISSSSIISGSPRTESWRGSTVAEPVYVSDPFAFQPFLSENESIFTFSNENIKNSFIDCGGYASEFTENIPSLPPSVPNGTDGKPPPLRLNLSFVVDGEEDEDGIEPVPMVPVSVHVASAVDSVHCSKSEDQIEYDDQKEPIGSLAVIASDEPIICNVSICLSDNESVDVSDDGDGQFVENNVGNDEDVDEEVDDVWDHKESDDDDTKCDDDENDEDVEELYCIVHNDDDDEKCDSEELIQLPCFMGNFTAAQSMHVEFKKDDIVKPAYSAGNNKECGSTGSLPGVQSFLNERTGNDLPRAPNARIPPATSSVAATRDAEGPDLDPAPAAASMDRKGTCDFDGIGYAEGAAPMPPPSDQPTAQTSDCMATARVPNPEFEDNDDTRAATCVGDWVFVDNGDEDKHSSDDDADYLIRSNCVDDEDSSTEESEDCGLLSTQFEIDNDNAAIRFIQYPLEERAVYPSIEDHPHYHPLIHSNEDPECKLSEETSIDGEESPEGSSESDVHPNGNGAVDHIAESQVNDALCPNPINVNGSGSQPLRTEIAALRKAVSVLSNDMNAVNEALHSIQNDLNQERHEGPKMNNGKACGAWAYC